MNFRLSPDSGMPLSVRVLFILNIGFFLGDFLTRGAYFSAWMALDPWAVTRDFQVWRLVTYMFVHDAGSIWHIVFNMLMLWMFGVPVAREMGERSFLTMYLGAGVFAGLCSMAWYGAMSDPTVIVGASGPLFALLVAFARFFPDQQLLMMFIFPVPVRYAVIIIGVIELLLITSNDRIAHVAHLGGALYAWIYLRWFFGRGGGGGFAANWKHRQVKKRWENAQRDGEKLREAMEDIDPILQKIGREGMDSLTRDERRKLERVSEMKRKLHGGGNAPPSDYYKNR
jgi:membrane associated rhomboid family serine protease